MDVPATGSLYVARRGEDPHDRGVSDESWSGLGMDDVFARLDRCATEIGRQTLYRRLRRASDGSAAVTAVDRRVRAFAADEALRAGFAGAVAPLASEGALAGLLWGDACVERGDVLAPIDRLLAAALAVAALESERVADDLDALRLALVVAEEWRRTVVKETTATLLGFVKVVFRLDVDAFVLTRELERGRPALRRLAEIIGELDVAQAVAGFRAESAAWSVPAIGRRGAPLVMTGMRDPLGAGTAADDVLFVFESSTHDETTPLKSIAVQSILAQSIATTTCEGYAAPFVTEDDFVTRCAARLSRVSSNDDAALR
ncbi:MAG: hypothetical protein KIT84_14690 [Labilithrix sp.]|nr:hypothetical protein [Labilithrix sp.]MCW5812269.1 hypothetical protein [Labilithrix sp.]